MIFQQIDKVLDGTQTQTRRLVKPGQVGVRLRIDSLEFAPVGFGAGDIIDVRVNGRSVYGVNAVYGKTYAVQPGRGKPAVCRIRILSIRREDVREISDADVLAEGFESRVHFLMTWAAMHDKQAIKPLEYFNSFGDGNFRVEKHTPDGVIYLYEALTYVRSRPAERYDAWALTFEVVNDAR